MAEKNAASEQTKMNDNDWEQRSEGEEDNEHAEEIEESTVNNKKKGLGNIIAADKKKPYKPKHQKKEYKEEKQEGGKGMEKPKFTNQGGKVNDGLYNKSGVTVSKTTTASMQKPTYSGSSAANEHLKVKGEVPKEE